MSDVETSDSSSSQEGASSSEAADQSFGERAPPIEAPATKAPAAPATMADKIAKFKDGGTAAKAAAPAPGAAKSKAAELNTSSGAPGDAAKPAAATPTPEEAAKALVKEYAPNYKYKFKGEEKDIPEAFKALMKDPESEKTVRELFEKSMGLDELRPKHQEIAKAHEGLTKGLSKLDAFLERDPKTSKPKDLNKFLSTFALTDQDVFDYAKERLQYHQLPTDQRQMIDAEQAARAEAEQLRAENATLQTVQHEARAQQRDTQLRDVMNHPNIAPVVAGHPGGQAGFYRDVATHAWLHEQATGQDLTPEGAVLSYIQQRGLRASPVQQAIAPAALGGQSQPAPAPQERAPTLPTVPSQGTSPARKVITSLKDLKAARDRANAALQE